MVGDAVCFGEAEWNSVKALERSSSWSNITKGRCKFHHKGAPYS